MSNSRDELVFLKDLKTRLNKIRNDLLDMGYDEKTPIGKSLTELHVMINSRETTLMYGGRF